MYRSSWTGIIIVGIFTFSTGCQWIASQIADSLAEGKMKSIKREFAIPKAAAFSDCMKTRGSECKASANLTKAIVPLLPIKTPVFSKEFSEAVVIGMKSAQGNQVALETSSPPKNDEGALKAAAVLFHPVHQKLASVYDHVSEKNVAGLTSSLPEKELRFTYRELLDYRTLIEDATLNGGWAKLQRWSEQQQATAAFTDSEGKAQISLLERIGKFTAAYLGAYFRNGEFATFQVDVSHIRESLKKDLGIADDRKLDAIFKVVFADNYKANPTGYYFGSIGRVAFVTRGGAAYQFPVLETRMNIGVGQPFHLPTVQLADVGADLVRLVLEATFDATFGVPGVSNATGTKVGQDEERIALKVFEPDPSGVNESEFGMINEIANQVEAGVGSAVGQAIRGGGPISLNNEALAKLIETLVGVTIRKTTEKVAWCLFACNITDIPKDADATRALAYKGDAFDQLDQAKLTIIVE